MKFLKINILMSAACLLSSCETAPTKRQLADSPLLTGMKPEMERFIEASRPNRTAGEMGHEAAFQFLKARFEEVAARAGGKVYVHEFKPDVEFAVKSYKSDFDNLIRKKFPPASPEYRKWKGFTDGAIKFVRGFKNVTGKNLILEIPGHRIPDETVYVGAHYDTITHDHGTLHFTPDLPAPGADDNASGIMSLLAAARELSQRPHDATLRFVAFDFEEIFFLGSYALAGDLSAMRLRWIHPNEKIIGLFNLEMIGWSKTNVSQNPVVKIYTRMPDSPGFEPDMRLARSFIQGAVDSKAQIKPVVLSNGFDRSDNWSFWKWSFPAVCISEDWEQDFNEKNYHTPYDTPDTLNFGFTREITLALIEAVDLASRNPQPHLQ